MSTRSRIKAFEIFTKALALLETQDKELFTWPRNRITLTHALAVHIHDILEDHTYSVDLYPAATKSRRTSNADILVHNRQSGHQILAIVCRNDYLTEQEQKDLSSLMEGNSQEGTSCDLVLAVSFMPQRSYMLIYIANDDGVEYYHFDRNLMIMEPVRRRTIEEELNDREQPTLVKIKRRRRSRSQADEEAPQVETSTEAPTESSVENAEESPET